MQEYRDVRKHHTLVEICKQPELAAEVTITAAEKLGVDAAIIFADLLLPSSPWASTLSSRPEKPRRSPPRAHCRRRPRFSAPDRAEELCLRAAAITEGCPSLQGSARHHRFCGAPYTLASYMIEGGGSRNYIHTKQMMYRDTLSWRLLLDKNITVLEQYCRLQRRGRANVIQLRQRSCRQSSDLRRLAPSMPSAWCRPLQRRVCGTPHLLRPATVAANPRRCVIASTGAAVSTGLTRCGSGSRQPRPLQAAVLLEDRNDLVNAGGASSAYRDTSFAWYGCNARAAAFNHVAGKRVRRAAEADDAS